MKNVFASKIGMGKHYKLKEDLMTDVEIGDQLFFPWTLGSLQRKIDVTKYPLPGNRLRTSGQLA